MNLRLSDVTKQRRLFYGWWIVLVTGIGLFMGYVPIIGFTFTIFFSPLAEEFKWNRAQISLAFSLSLMVLSVAMPLTGRLVDRTGSRRIILPASLLFGGALASFYWLSPNLWHYYAVYIFIGIVGSGVTPIPYYNVLSRWFDKRRGMALGLAMIGVGASELIMPVLGQNWISQYGWRAAYLMIGLMVAGITFPAVALFFKERPQEMGLLPDGSAEAQERTPHAKTQAAGMSAREAMRTSTFWLMSASFFLTAMSLVACLVHMAPMLRDRGMTAATAALVTSVLGGANLAGRVGTGYLLDRFPANWLALCFFTCSGLGLMMLWAGAGGALVFVAAFLIGVGMGAEGDFMAYLVGRYFGLRAFGEVYGYVMSIYTLGALLGPVVMGINFDRLRSYQLALGAFTLLTVLGAALMSQLGPYRRWEIAEVAAD